MNMPYQNVQAFHTCVSLEFSIGCRGRRMGNLAYVLLSDIEHHCGKNPAQAAMINWTVPVTAGAACNRIPHSWMQHRIKRCPACIVGWTKDGDTGSIDRTGDVSWTSIVADKEV